MKRTQGFTLIEVMIVVVIVAILAAIAVPSYDSHIRKTNRSDAKEILVQVAAAQEKFFFQNNNYGQLAQLGYNSNQSPDGYYTILVLGSDEGGDLFCGPENNSPCYKVTAVANVGSRQHADERCRTFVIHHTGRKESLASDSSTDTTDECW